MKIAAIGQASLTVSPKPTGGCHSILLQNRRSLSEQNEFIRKQSEQALLIQLSDPGSPPILRHLALKDLQSQMPLSGRNLSGAYLADLDMQGLDLSRAVLNKANLDEANLKSAQLAHANLYSASLRKTNLAGANLGDAHLDEAKLSGSILDGANLSGASLKGAYFGPVLWLKEAEGQPLQLPAASLKNVTLMGCDFTDADLTEVDLAGADLSKCRGLRKKQVDKAKTDSATKFPVDMPI